MRQKWEKSDDEWYTYYDDIDNELSNFKDELRGRNIYCSCDTDDSNFVKYFKDNFNELGIKKLAWSHIDYNVIKEYDGNSIKEIDVIVGDCLNFFVTDYCVRNNVIVVTNPPFSLARLYLDELVCNNLDYIVVYPVLNFNNKITAKLYIDRSIKVGNLVSKFFNKDNKKAVLCQWMNSFKDLYSFKEYNFVSIDEMIIDKDYLLRRTVDGDVIQLRGNKFPTDFEGYIVLLTNFVQYKYLKDYNYYVLRNVTKDDYCFNHIFSSVCVKKKGDNNNHENL